MIICLQVRLLGSAPLVPYMRKTVTVTEAVTTPQIQNTSGYLLNKKTNIIEKEDSEDKEVKEEKEEKVEKEDEGKKQFQIPPVLKLLVIVILLMIILTLLTEWADLSVLLEISRHHMITEQM